MKGTIAELSNSIDSLTLDSEDSPPSKEEEPIPRMIFPIAFGPSIVDRRTQDVLRYVHKIRLPAKRWGALPSWRDLKQAEIRRILEAEGEQAFIDTHPGTGDSRGRGKLLNRRYKPGGEDVLELTPEAERALQIREGLRHGFRFFDPNTDEEYFVRLFQVGSGYLHVGLSWFGMAGPWVDDWRQELQTHTVDIAASIRQGILLEDLNAEHQEQVERLVRRARILEDGQKIMEAVLAQVGRQGKNPITIPAMVFRVLLNLENDKNWKARVEAGFNALRACTFRVDSFEMPRIRGAGAFLGEWWYKGAGPGAHGEGAYLLNVQPGFIGCLSAFESGKRKLSSDRQQTIYDFMKKLSWQERKTLRFNKTDAGTPFYNAAAGLPPEQQSLLAFIEREITLRRDPIRKGHNATRVRPNAPGAGEARLYGHDFCPLIPTGKCYQGALGHFRNWPETGRTLFGTPLGAGIARGSHQGGLLSELGFQVPTGRSYSTRSSIVRTALAAFKVVVVDYLEGLVAARSADGEWLTLDDASKLHNEALRRKKWFLFLPENWRELRKRKWEARMGERAARGETPFAWRVTENPEEAECAHQTLSARAWSAGEPECGQVELPLHVRLRATRIDRRLSQGDVGRLLGVSQKTISQWERGAKPDDEGIVRGDSIPPRMLHLVRRWVETGESPTAEALADPRP